jgi:hypothetical protein
VTAPERRDDETRPAPRLIMPGATPETIPSYDELVNAARVVIGETEEDRAKRPYVVVFGEPYYYLDPMELSLVDQVRFRDIERAVDGLRRKEAEANEPWSIEDAEALSERLGEMTIWILPGLPEDVLAKIRDSWRMVILDRFTPGREPIQLRTAQAAPIRRKPARRGAK